MIEKLLTISDVAQILSVHPKTVKKEIYVGRLLVVMIRGAMRIQLTDLRAYIEANTQKRGGAYPGPAKSALRYPPPVLLDDPCLKALLARPKSGKKNT